MFFHSTTKLRFSRSSRAKKVNALVFLHWSLADVCVSCTPDLTSRHNTAAPQQDECQQEN